MELFGCLPTGEEVHRITVASDSLKMNVLTYGAVIQDLRLLGQASPLVLGFTEFSHYLNHSPYFGATAGRCANRIRDGHLEINGRTYQLDKNFIDKHHLHGGIAGIGKRVWQVAELTSNAVTLGINLVDGEMGYPGNMAISVTLSLSGAGVLDIRMQATTDAPTLCNLAHHSYFNLDGCKSVSDHSLLIKAEHFLPVDKELIPTGEVNPVAGSRFDFRESVPVSQAHPIDTNFCLSENRVALRPVAWLSSAVSGVTMKCSTTEPGLQIYDGANINIAQPGLMGRPMGAFSGIAMEPQIWPDAVHHDHFPQAILNPGQTYDQRTQYCFSKNATQAKY